MTIVNPLQRRHLRAALATLALAGAGATVMLEAGAATLAAASTMAPVTVHGTLVKVLGMSSFTMKAGAKHYTVKVDAMTHIKLDGKTVKLSHLRPGDTVVVKGPLEMGTITATSVVAGM